MSSTSSAGKVSRKEDNMLSVDGFRADEFTGRHLGLYPGKEYEWRGMLSFSSL